MDSRGLIRLLGRTTDRRPLDDMDAYQRDRIVALRRRVAELEARLRLGQCEACACIEAGLRLLPRTTGLVVLAGRGRES
jgi:hypothetical protein